MSQDFPSLSWLNDKRPRFDLRANLWLQYEIDNQQGGRRNHYRAEEALHDFAEQNKNTKELISRWRQKFLLDATKSSGASAPNSLWRRKNNHIDLHFGAPHKKKKQKKKHGMTPVGIGARVIIFELHPREQGPSPPTRSSKGCEEKEKVKQNQKKTWSASAAPRRWQPGEPKRLNYNRRAPKSISAPLSRLKLLPHSNTAAIRSAICQAQKIGKKNIHKRSRELPVWGGPLLQQPRRPAVPDTRMMRSVRG